MRKQKVKEQIITELLDEYLIKKRAGESPPNFEEYIEMYPEFTSDIKKAVAKEMDWMLKFNKIAEEIKLPASDVDTDLAWNRLYNKLQKAWYQKILGKLLGLVFIIKVAAFKFTKHGILDIRATSGRVVENGRIIFSDLSALLTSISKGVRIALSSALVAAVVIFLFSIIPSNNYSDLAQIEKVPYKPIAIRGATEAEELFEKAMDFYKKEEYSKAIEILKTLLNMNPNDVNTQFYLGLVYLLDNKVDKAIELFNEAKKLSGSSLREKCHWYLGNAYLLKDDEEKALEEFQKVLEFEGDYWFDAQDMVKEIDERMGNKAY